MRILYTFIFILLPSIALATSSLRLIEPRVQACGETGVCSCSDSGIVNCSQRALTDIPDGIPANTTTLFLRSNQITKIPTGKLNNCTELGSIDFSQNSIATIDEGAFLGLNKLRAINLQFNSLTSLEGQQFNTLSRLEVISLTFNRITFIDRLFVYYLPSNVNQILLDGNRLNCTCDTMNFALVSKMRNITINGTCQYADDIRPIANTTDLYSSLCEGTRTTLARGTTDVSVRTDPLAPTPRTLAPPRNFSLILPATPAVASPSDQATTIRETQQTTTTTRRATTLSAGTTRRTTSPGTATTTTSTEPTTTPTIILTTTSTTTGTTTPITSTHVATPITSTPLETPITSTPLATPITTTTPITSTPLATPIISTPSTTLIISTPSTTPTATPFTTVSIIATKRPTATVSTASPTKSLSTPSMSPLTTASSLLSTTLSTALSTSPTFTPGNLSDTTTSHSSLITKCYMRYSNRGDHLTWEICEPNQYCSTVIKNSNGQNTAKGECLDTCEESSQCRGKGICEINVCCRGDLCNKNHFDGVRNHATSYKWAVYIRRRATVQIVKLLDNYFTSLSLNVEFELKQFNKTSCLPRTAGCFYYVEVELSTNDSALLLTQNAVKQHIENQTVRSGQSLTPITAIPYEQAQCRKPNNGTLDLGWYTMESCPNTKRKMEAKRYCIWTENGADWTDLDTTMCPTEHTEGLNDILNNFNNSSSSADRSRSVRLVNSALNSSSPASLGAQDVRLVNDILEKSLESATPSTEEAEEYLTTFNTLFSANASTLEAANGESRTAERLIKNIEKFTASIQLRRGEKNWSRESGNLYIHLVDVDAEANPKDHYEISASDITVDIPSEAVKGNNSRVQFLKFKRPTMFEAIEESEGDSDSKPIISPVLSISIGERNISNLTNSVSMRLKPRSTILSNQTTMCYYWDWSNNSWSSDGVITRHEGDVTVCESNHLTNFALLLNVNPYNNGSVTEEHQKILSIISLIGCSISLASLIITLIIYIMFRPIRKDNPSKILMNLCSALLLLNLVFVTLTHFKDNDIVCKITGVLLHYSLLASFTWMAVESFYMYIALILVFSYIKRFMLKVSLVGWGVPLLIVAITLAISPDNYQLYQNQLCWVKEEAFFGAVLGPIAVIWIINIIAFIMVVKQLCNVNNRRAAAYSEKNMHDQRKKIYKNIRGAIAVFVLLGLTWLFAGLLLFNDNLVFNYLFAICNSLQGFFLFIFYCILKKEVKVQCIKFLPCCEYEGPYTGSSSQRYHSASNNTMKSRTTVISTTSTINSTGV